MKNILILLLALTLISCSESNSQNSNTTEDKFTWNVQKSGYDFDQYDDKGETDYENFISEFEKFPWMKQLDYFKYNQGGCSPTLSVKDLKTGKDFWVSMIGDRNDHDYLIGYIYPKEVTGLFGIGKPKKIRWLKMYLVDDKELVKYCFKLFFIRNHRKLENKIRLLEEYGQMEAQN